MTIICDTCGRTFTPTQQDKPGEMTGVSFVMETGYTINMCASCLKIIGGEDCKKRRKIFRRIESINDFYKEKNKS